MVDNTTRAVTLYRVKPPLIGHLHDGDILLLRLEFISFFLSYLILLSQRGLNNKSPNSHKKEKLKRILVVVVKLCHRANGPSACGVLSDIMSLRVTYEY